MLSGVETTAKKGANRTYRGGKKLAQTTAKKVRAKREISHTLLEVEHSGGKTVEAAKDTASKIRTKNTAAKAIREKTKKVVKTSSRSVKGVKQRVKGVKTAQRTEKTAQQTAKATQKTAQATAKATKVAAKAAKAAAKVAVTELKAAVQATATAMKAAAAAVKVLIVLIAAGGWVAVVIILFICLIDLVVGSCFDLFFGSDSTGTGTSVTQTVPSTESIWRTYRKSRTPMPTTGRKSPPMTGCSSSIGRTSSPYFPPK